MEEMPRNACVSVFINNTDDLSKVFTELWSDIINVKENYEYENDVLQTNVSGL